MLGIHRVLQNFRMLGVVEKREGVAFGVNGALLERGVGFAPRHRSGVHAEFGGDGHFNRGVGGTDLQVHKIGNLLQGLLGSHEVTVAEFAEHDRLQADAFRDLVQSHAKLALVKSLVELLLILGRSHIGQVDGHVRFGEAGEVRGGAGRQIERAGLRSLGGHAVAAELTVGENLDTDFLVALLFHQFLELLVAHGDVVARSHGVPEAEGQRFFSSCIIGHAEDHAGRGQKGGYSVQNFFHHMTP